MDWMIIIRIMILGGFLIGSGGPQLGKPSRRLSAHETSNDASLRREIS
jgi:hypothetical protein